MKYKVIVQRISEHKDIKSPRFSHLEDSTLSNVEVQDENGKVVFKCFCCENIGESTDTPKQDKRIIAREYELEWTYSTKNATLSKYYPKWKSKDGKLNKALWLTCDKVLPSFRNRRILIHIGNYPQDTEGCLLFGYTKGAGIVGGSTNCINDFFTFVKKEGVENFTLVVKEI